MKNKAQEKVEKQCEKNKKELMEMLLEQPKSTASKPAPSVWRELGMLGLKITALILVFVALFSFVYGIHRNTDADMSPMVKSGDLVLFYRLDRNYAIGDLLLLDFQGTRQVRRVVARVGDRVDILDGALIINGAMQQEPEIFGQTFRYENGPDFPLIVQPGQVFVLGDAREGATDGRVYGVVDTRDTLGNVITIIRRRHF